MTCNKQPAIKSGLSLSAILFSSLPSVFRHPNYQRKWKTWSHQHVSKNDYFSLSKNDPLFLSLIHLLYCIYQQREWQEANANMILFNHNNEFCCTFHKAFIDTLFIIQRSISMMIKMQLNCRTTEQTLT